MVEITKRPLIIVTNYEDRVPENIFKELENIAADANASVDELVKKFGSMYPEVHEKSHDITTCLNAQMSEEDSPLRKYFDGIASGQNEIIQTVKGKLEKFLFTKENTCKQVNCRVDGIVSEKSTLSSQFIETGEDIVGAIPQGSDVTRNSVVTYIPVNCNAYPFLREVVFPGSTSIERDNNIFVYLELGTDIKNIVYSPFTWSFNSSFQDNPNPKRFLILNPRSVEETHRIVLLRAGIGSKDYVFEDQTKEEEN